MLCAANVYTHEILCFWSFDLLRGKSVTASCTLPDSVRNYIQFLKRQHFCEKGSISECSHHWSLAFKILSPLWRTCTCSWTLTLLSTGGCADGPYWDAMWWYSPMSPLAATTVRVLQGSRKVQNSPDGAPCQSNVQLTGFQIHMSKHFPWWHWTRVDWDPRWLTVTSLIYCRLPQQDLHLTAIPRPSTTVHIRSGIYCSAKFINDKIILPLIQVYSICSSA